MKARQRSDRRSATTLYEPLDGFVLRAPLLSLESYRALSLDPTAEASFDEIRRLASDEHVRRALAVGSVSLLDALARDGQRASRVRKSHSRVLRYLIRMATRPTPFGLFAGVALGQWGERTDLEIRSGSLRPRTRPDMAWLMALVTRLEAMPDVVRRVKLIANPSALVHAGRVFLAERVASSGSPQSGPVSIRATGVVRRALIEARQPISYAELVSSLLASTPGATAERVETLLTQLRQQTFLLTDLRPPLTVESPARHVVDRLEGIAAADDIRRQIEAALAAAAAWDASPPIGGAERYRAMVETAGRVARVERSPFQVDAGLELTAHTVNRNVGDEVARLADLLVRISPLPQGPVYLSAYRELFERQYGVRREVPVLELLDPNFGLGPPSIAEQSSPIRGVSQASIARRNRALSALALTALRERTLAVELNEATVKELESGVAPIVAPSSLDLFVAIAARSPQALDAGEFQVVLGPGVGASAAGRTLGRFADIVTGAPDFLARIARAEERAASHALWAELTYQPRSSRLANVAICPNVRGHAIVVGTTSDASTRAIPLDELVVGVRHGRFYLRWPSAHRDVIVTSGHMLNPTRAPAVCRFLADLSRDGCRQLAGFNWGPAAGFPFLPRVQVGRSVLGLARWRLTMSTAAAVSAHQPRMFPEAFAQWRACWDVPRHVYLMVGDNRLLLDVLNPPQAEELRSALVRLRGYDSLTLSEVLPDLDHAWVRDSDHRAFVTELAVPLVLRARGSDAAAALDEPDAAASDVADAALLVNIPVASAARVRPPGSEWLFVKLYGPRDLEDDLIVGAVRRWAMEAIASGMADAWFFLRYADPERHVRLRFHGEPRRLLQDLLPAICVRASALIGEGRCRRFAFDTYEQESERFGGSRAMPIAEDLFAADSRAVADLLHLSQTTAGLPDSLVLAVSTVDTILGGMGLDAGARMAWARGRAGARHETSDEYRRRKDTLRAWLAPGLDHRGDNGRAAVAPILADLSSAVRKVNQRYAALARNSQLPLSVGALCQSFIHLHLNRLLGADGSTERRVFGLWWRTLDALRYAPLETPGFE